MSVFAGLLNFDGRPVDPHKLERLAAALPRFDGRLATSSIAGPAGFVHRAFPITAEDHFERQPWTGAGGQHHLVFAGSLDNRPELAGSLGVELHGTADGALCLAAIERWGADAPAHLHGGFAYGFWDESARRLQLCRDRSGTRSLFYTRGGTFLAFASTINALLALPEVPREMDVVVVADLLALNNGEPTRTVYRGIHRLPSGSHALCGDGRIDVQAYWEPQCRPLHFKRQEDYVETARDMLGRCVASAMRSEKPVGVTTSGGLDSSGVAATAARQAAPDTLSVYTRVPPPGFARAETPRAYFDERSKVQALARRHPNMAVTFVDDAGPHAFDADPRRAAAAFGVPMIGVVNFGWFASLYDRVAGNGHRVLFGGGGGNASLGWHAPHFFEDLMQRGRFVRAGTEAIAYQRRAGRPWLDVLRSKLLAPLQPVALRQARRRRKGLGIWLEHNGFIDADFARTHDVQGRIAASRDGGLAGMDTFTRRVRGTVRSNEIGRDRRATMLELYGFEMRNPLLDPGMLELCLNIPDEQFQRAGQPRALQRDVIADRVPAEIVDNFKVGVQAPEWFDRVHPLRETLLADIARIERSALASGMIDMKRLKRATEDWPATAEQATTRQNELRQGLMRAIAIGRFICWFEGVKV